MIFLNIYSLLIFWWNVIFFIIFFRVAFVTFSSTIFPLQFFFPSKLDSRNSHVFYFIIYRTANLHELSPAAEGPDSKGWRQHGESGLQSPWFTKTGSCVAQGWSINHADNCQEDGLHVEQAHRSERWKLHLRR